MSGWLRITVSDQGKGFDLSAVALQARSDMIAPGYGLFSTRERMLSLGGRFEIQTGPGKGTLATLVVPITPRVAPSSPTNQEPEVRPNEPSLVHRHVATNNGNDHGAAVRAQPAKNANGTRSSCHSSRMESTGRKKYSQLSPPILHEFGLPMA